MARMSLLLGTLLRCAVLFRAAVTNPLHWFRNSVSYRLVGLPKQDAADRCCGSAMYFPNVLKADGVNNSAAMILINMRRVQDNDVADGTTSVTVLASELLRKAEELIEQKLLAGGTKKHQTRSDLHRRCRASAERIRRTNRDREATQQIIDEADRTPFACWSLQSKSHVS